MTDPGALDAAFKVAEILGIIGGLVGGLFGVGVGLYRIGRMSERVEAAIERQSDNMAAIERRQSENMAAVQTELRKLNEVVTNQALQAQRSDVADSRMDRLERLVDDLRRGEGHIYPLDRVLGARKPKEG